MVTVVIIACIMLVLAVGTVGAIHMRTWYEYERQTADMHRENNVQLRRMNAVMEETVREYRLAQEGALKEETEEESGKGSGRTECRGSFPCSSHIKRNLSESGSVQTLQSQCVPYGETPGERVQRI